MLSYEYVYHEFSPHTRGCSVREATYDFQGAVFPAYAGMFP